MFIDMDNPNWFEYTQSAFGNILGNQQNIVPKFWTFAKCKMQNAKCKMQNAKCKMQNAKCKMQNAKKILEKIIQSRRMV